MYAHVRENQGNPMIRRPKSRKLVSNQTFFSSLGKLQKLDIATNDHWVDQRESLHEKIGSAWFYHVLSFLNIRFSACCFLTKLGIRPHIADPSLAGFHVHVFSNMPQKIKRIFPSSAGKSSSKNHKGLTILPCFFPDGPSPAPSTKNHHVAPPWQKPLWTFWWGVVSAVFSSVAAEKRHEFHEFKGLAKNCLRWEPRKKLLVCS